MIEKKTVVDQIEITRSGVIQIRFGVLLVEDGVEVASAWHRTSIEPGTDPDAQMASVNAHLAQMGKAQVDAPDLGKVKNVVALMHTPEVKAQFAAKRADAMAKLVHGPKG
jgi:hypothetical protein